MKISYGKIHKIAVIVVTLVMIGILIWSIYFVYFYVYQTIILVPAIEELQTQVSFNLVRIDLFEQNIEHLQKKITYREINWFNIINPF